MNEAVRVLPLYNLPALFRKPIEFECEDWRSFTALAFLSRNFFSTKRRYIVILDPWRTGKGIS
jgi:hypothetical protein